eukprot:scaffold55205_cov21-Tisochrysis_lutea.AAC.1
MPAPSVVQQACKPDNAGGEAAEELWNFPGPGCLGVVADGAARGMHSLRYFVDTVQDALLGLPRPDSSRPMEFACCLPVSLKLLPAVWHRVSLGPVVSLIPAACCSWVGRANQADVI